MIVIADSGSSKTLWKLINKEGDIKTYTTKGYNPYHIDSDGIVEDLRTHLYHEIEDEHVDYVFFYGAGCSTEAKCDIVSLALRIIFPYAEVMVTHDMLGAARGTLSRREGLVGILGTGSNICLYDGTEITKGITSLGYVLGDEGGGVYLGKMLLKTFMGDFMPEHLSKEFIETYKLNKEDILDAIYKKPQANRFMASFSTFLLPRIEDDFVRSVVWKNFSDYFDYMVSLIPNYKSYPMQCIGSIGFHFSDVLKDVARSKGVSLEQIHQSPIEGLVKYHLEH
ncbi:MAG: N-acetylglucosamine kinase [Bacteroidota bacterium]